MKNPSPMPQVQPVQKHMLYETGQNPEQIEQRRGVYGTNKIAAPTPPKQPRGPPMKLHQSRTNDTVLAPPQTKAQPQPPQPRSPQPQYMGPSAINTPNIPPPRAAAANPNSKKPVSVHNSIKLLVQNNYRQRLAKKQQPPAPAQVAKPSYYQNGTRTPAVLNNAVKPQYQSAARPAATAPQSNYGQRQNGWSSQNKWNNS